MRRPREGERVVIMTSPATVGAIGWVGRLGTVERILTSPGFDAVAVVVVDGATEPQAFRLGELEAIVDTPEARVELEKAGAALREVYRDARRRKDVTVSFLDGLEARTRAAAGAMAPHLAVCRCSGVCPACGRPRQDADA